MAEVAQFGNHLYFLTDNAASWPDAETLAVNAGGHLVAITSQAEQDFLDANFDPTGGGNELFIGLYQDTQDPAYSENDGGWKWSSGEALTFTNWEPTEPSGGAAENYARYLSNFLWGDIANGASHRAIIEIDGCVLQGPPGCTDTEACNYDVDAGVDDGSCEYTSCQTFGCTDPTACNYDTEATFENGTCDFSCYGCTDPAAANHDGNATIDDGSCQYAGCTDPTAANYDGTADVDDGSCTYPGCTDPAACNHDVGANSDDGSCDYSCIGCTDATACNYSAEATQDDDSCDFSCYGCTDPAACNHDAGATEDDGSCTYANAGLDCAGDCLADADGDGVCDPFEVPGCTDAGATNYDAGATDDDGSCAYPAFTPDQFDFAATPASGSMMGQVTLDGVPAAGNDWMAAFDANGQCAGATEVVLDNGTAYFLLTIHGDDPTTPSVDEGMNEGEAFSLQLYRAATETYHEYYTANGTTSLDGWTNTNGSPIPGLDDPGTEYAFNSAPYSPECLDPTACNYDPASPGNLNCQYPDTGLDCNGNCLADDDGDGICNDDEVDGCTDSTACNYDPDATDDDGSCQALDACGVCGGPGVAPGTCDCEGNVADAIGVCGGDCAADADADGICDDADPCVGNYDACGVCNGPGAVYDCGCEDIPAGDCDCDGNQLDAAGVCGGDCTEDADGDGLCDDVDPCIGTVDACGLCNGPGAIYDCGCEDIPSGDCDCDGNQLDAAGICGGDCTEDADQDGICDDSDPCIGTEDACGVCDGPGAIYECGCSDIPEGDCDCNGNQLDALGVCGGPCAADADGDGLCDDVDDCVGNYDACGVCNGPGAVYECGCEDIPAGDCDCNGNQLDALGVCGGTCAGDEDADGVCDDAETLGCTDDTACNYAASATEEDGSCTYPPALYDCAGDCLDDTDGDGICDALENPGCTDPDALNYNALATDDDGSCTLPEPPPAQFDFTGTPASATLFGQATLDGEPCGQGDWIAAFDPDGNCAGAAQLINYDGAAYINLTIYGDDATTTTVDEGINAGEPFTLLLWDASVGQTVAYVDAFGETELTGWSNTNGAPLPGFDDPTVIYNFLSSGFIPNCLDPTGCNYDPDSETSEGCVYPETGYDCNGDCLADEDEDGICDPFEIPGCTDAGACNYAANATDDDDSCTYPADGYDCADECLQDTDEDGVCDPFEIPGCSDATACNYNAAATDSAECTYPDSGYDCVGNCLEDSDEDGVCDPFEIAGCQDPEACNYDATATDDGTCSYPATPYEDCDGTCFTDLDLDGVCDELDDCVGTLDGEGNCDEVDIPGCTYTAACNYDADANLDDGTCQFVPTGYDCDGNCLDDTDGDGVCDPNELPGCDDPTAVNYSPLATDDDGSCQYGEVSDCPMDLSGDGVVGIADILQILSSYGLDCPE